MSDQELLDRITQGDQAALTELCDRYAELIRKRAQWIARQYNCLRPGSHGGWSDYTKETLSELESVGMLTLIECAMNGGYDSSKEFSEHTTYHFWTARCGGTWKPAWVPFPWTGTAWGWYARRRCSITGMEKR